MRGEMEDAVASGFALEGALVGVASHQHACRMFRRSVPQTRDVLHFTKRPIEAPERNPLQALTAAISRTTSGPAELRAVIEGRAADREQTTSRRRAIPVTMSRKVAFCRDVVQHRPVVDHVSRLPDR